jgi:uncharacterized protein HemX
MTALETGLALAVAALLAALLAGAGIYVKLTPKVLMREEHDKVCERNTEPFRRDIKALTKDAEDIKATVRRLEDKHDQNAKHLSDKQDQTAKHLSDKQDEVTKDLSGKLQKILLELAKINGASK